MLTNHLQLHTTTMPSARLCLAAFAILPMLSACNRLTAQNYERISLGSGFDDVHELLGAPTRCDDTLALRACIWGDEKRNIRVSFVAGKAVLFSSHNLE